MTERPNIAPDQVIFKLARLKIDVDKMQSQADRAFNRFMEDVTDEQRYTIWMKAIERLGDLVEEEARLGLMRETWKAILNEEQQALAKEIGFAQSRAANLSSRSKRNEDHLRMLYFG